MNSGCSSPCQRRRCPGPVTPVIPAFRWSRYKSQSTSGGNSSGVGWLLKFVQGFPILHKQLNITLNQGPFSKKKTHTGDTHTPALSVCMIGAKTNIGSPSHPSFFHRQGLSSHPRKIQFFVTSQKTTSVFYPKIKGGKADSHPRAKKRMEVANENPMVSPEGNPPNLSQLRHCPWHRYFSPQFWRRAASRLSPPDLFPLETSSGSPWSLDTPKNWSEKNA